MTGILNALLEIYSIILVFSSENLSNSSRPMIMDHVKSSKRYKAWCISAQAFIAGLSSRASYLRSPVPQYSLLDINSPFHPLELNNLLVLIAISQLSLHKGNNSFIERKKGGGRGL